MTHTNDGTLQAFLDEALEPSERASVSRHLASCATCTAELNALRTAAERFTSFVQAVDTVTPPSEQTRLAVQRARWQRRSVSARRTLARAAGLIVLLAAGAAVAMPGSPVRDWLRGLLADEEPAAPVVTEPVAVEEPLPTPTTGVAVLPLDGRVRIVIEDAARGTRVHIRPIEGDEASVQAAGLAADARFLTAPGEIRVMAAGAGDLIVELPRGVDDGEIVVDGTLLCSVVDGELRTATEPDRRSGELLMFRVGG